MPGSPVIAHVTLTVSDLNRSVPWYERVFDTKLVLDEEPGPFRRAVWLAGGQTLVGFHQFPDPADNLPFNERLVGLDHLALACSSRSELEAWKVRLDELGIVNGGVVDALTVLGCPSVIQTTSRWNSSRHPHKRSPRAAIGQPMKTCRRRRKALAVLAAAPPSPLTRRCGRDIRPPRRPGHRAGVRTRAALPPCRLHRVVLSLQSVKMAGSDGTAEDPSEPEQMADTRPQANYRPSCATYLGTLHQMDLGRGRADDAGRLRSPGHLPQRSLADPVRGRC